MVEAMRTPLYDWHVAHGARIVDFAGWDMPIQYGTIIDEHHTVRRHAGMFDISHMGRLWFDGPDALDLIQAVFTNDAATMKDGQVRYGLVCNNGGGILDDVLVYRFPQAWMMVVNASNRDKIVAWLKQLHGKRQARVEDRTLSRGMVAFQGPEALRLTAALAEQAGWTSSAGASLDSLKYYFATTLKQKDGGEVIVSRTGYTGEDGFEIIVDNAGLVPLCELAVNLASQLGIELKPCGLGARDTLRLEAAMPLYGHELNEEIDPFQAGLAWAVKLDKGDFIGKAALQARKNDATLRRRVGLVLEGKRIAREGSPLQCDGTEVGRICSGTFAPTLERTIAMGYVDAGFLQPGTRLEVDIRGKNAAALVVPLPFYKRK
jgi:aminomethyltransferase